MRGKIVRQINYLLFKINSFRPLFFLLKCRQLDWNVNYTPLCIFLWFSVLVFRCVVMEIWFEMTWTDHWAGAQISFVCINIIYSRILMRQWLSYYQQLYTFLYEPLKFSLLKMNNIQIQNRNSNFFFTIFGLKNVHVHWTRIFMNVI